MRLTAIIVILAVATLGGTPGQSSAQGGDKHFPFRDYDQRQTTATLSWSLTEQAAQCEGYKRSGFAQLAEVHCETLAMQLDAFTNGTAPMLEACLERMKAGVTAATAITTIELLSRCETLRAQPMRERVERALRAPIKR